MKWVKGISHLGSSTLADSSLTHTGSVGNNTQLCAAVEQDEPGKLKHGRRRSDEPGSERHANPFARTQNPDMG